MAPKLSLAVLPGKLAVCRLPPEAPLPAWASGSFLCVTRTAEELSVVVAQERVPPGVECQREFRALRVEGKLDFSAVGILAALARPLAEAGISILAISTFDTDYVLVKQGELGRALAALRAAGHTVQER